MIYNSNIYFYMVFLYLYLNSIYYYYAFYYFFLFQPLKIEIIKLIFEKQPGKKWVFRVYFIITFLSFFVLLHNSFLLCIFYDSFESHIIVFLHVCLCVFYHLSCSFIWHKIRLYVCVLLLNCVFVFFVIIICTFFLFLILQNMLDVEKKKIE